MDVFPFNADVLFLPFKLKANTTAIFSAIVAITLFLPFKLKANTTGSRYFRIRSVLFLPFKLKANTTYRTLVPCSLRCFYLSN